MTSNDVSTLLRKMPARQVLVLGDLMLDQYLWGHIERISPEAPVPVLRLTHREQTLGGAGNVVKNLRSLEAQVTVLGVVGTDPTGTEILEELKKLDVDLEGVVREPSRPSTCKNRLMSFEHGQQVFRVDEESGLPINQETQQKLLNLIPAKMRGMDAVITSDYQKGVLTTEVVQTVVTLAQQRGVPSVISPKNSEPAKYHRASFLIPNVRELEQLAGVKIAGDDSLAAAAWSVLRQLEARALLVTRGAEGMSLFDASGNPRRVDIPTVARSVYDVTGAGDTVASVFALGIAAGANLETAARLANLAAGIVVEKRGTAAVTPTEILERIEAKAATKTALSSTL